MASTESDTNAAAMSPVPAPTQTDSSKGSLSGISGPQTPPNLDEPEPWPSPVQSAALLDEIAHELNRFVIVSPVSNVAVTLWIVHTHVLDAAEHSPILGVISPEKRCGKTTLLTLIEQLAYKAAPITHLTSANLFRTIGDGYVTLILDEADTYLASNPELVGMLNRGHMKAGAFTMRREPSEKGYVGKWFPLWSAKAIASIGKLWHTLADRSIRVPMRRLGRGERVERLRREDRETFLVLQRKLRRWSLDNVDKLRDADPELSEDLNNREADNWRPLAAIAAVGGQKWIELAREASLSLRARETDLATPGIQLLSDIRAAFRGKKVTFLPTENLLQALYAYDQSWLRYDYGKPLDAKGFAALLSPFDVTPTRRRTAPDKKPHRGYDWPPLEVAFQHYLPPDEPNGSDNELDPAHPVHPTHPVPPDPGVPGGANTSPMPDDPGSI